MTAVSGFSGPNPAALRRLRPRRDKASGLTTIAALVAERARLSGDEVAMSEARGARTVTWDDVAEAVDPWQHGFGGAWEPWQVADVRVGFLMSSPLDFGREYLAALAAGVTVVPLDASCSESELLWSSACLALTHLLGDGGELIKLHNVGRRGFGRSDHATPQLFPLSKHPSGAEPVGEATFGVGRAWHPSVAPLDVPLPSPAEIERAAIIVPTRGSTGAPKLVPLTERQVLFAAAGVVRHFRLRASDRGFVATPLHNVDSQVTGILAVLISGGSVVLAGGFDRRSFWSDVEQMQATWLNLAPAMVTSLADMPAPDCETGTRVRFGRVGGAALPLKVHAKFWQLTGISLVETYTLTEAAGPVAAEPVDLSQRRPGSVGLAVGTEVRIVDGSGQSLSPGTVGRIQVRGPSVTMRYLSYGRRRPSLPAQQADGWFDTGDLGCQAPAGSLFIAGREDSRATGEETNGATGRSSQVACGTPTSPLRAAAFRP